MNVGSQFSILNELKDPDLEPHMRMSESLRDKDIHRNMHLASIQLIVCKLMLGIMSQCGILNKNLYHYVISIVS